MKLATYFMDSSSGVNIYLLISLVIFFVFFVLVTWYVLKLDKQYIHEVSEMPLSSNNNKGISKNP